MYQHGGWAVACEAACRPLDYSLRMELSKFQHVSGGRLSTPDVLRAALIARVLLPPVTDRGVFWESRSNK